MAGFRLVALGLLLALAPRVAHAALNLGGLPVSGTATGAGLVPPLPPGTNYFDPATAGGLIPPGYGNSASNINSANNVPINPGGPSGYSTEFGYSSLGFTNVLEADVAPDGTITVYFSQTTDFVVTLTSPAFTGGLTLVPDTAANAACSGVPYSSSFDATNGVVTITVPAFSNSVACYLYFQLQAPICFPASSTLRRLVAGTADTWERVAMPQLRVGDTVECLAREPVFGGGASVASAAYGRLDRCLVYDYKKALPEAAAAAAPYMRITYEDPAGPAGAVVASATHHLLDPLTGQARQAGGVRPGDTVLRATPSGELAPARVLAVDRLQDDGAYAPLLSGGGLPIVDGVVVYPSSGESDVGLDAKHWGQYYLHAPVWQQLADAGATGNKARPAGTQGRTLAELGAQEPVGAFTKKWHAVRQAAAREGRSACDWAGVAAEMHAAIASQGKRYTEAEALAVLDRHLRAANGMAEA